MSGPHASHPVNFVALVRPARIPTPIVDLTSERDDASAAQSTIHQAVNCASSVAKCASENIRGYVTSAITATVAATVP